MAREGSSGRDPDAGDGRLGIAVAADGSASISALPWRWDARINTAATSAHTRAQALAAARAHLPESVDPSRLRPARGQPDVFVGDRVVVRPQLRRHERLVTVTTFSTVAAAAAVPAPTVLASGRTDSGGWWTVQERIAGRQTRAVRGRARRAEQLGRALAALHAAPLPDAGTWDASCLVLGLGYLTRTDPAAYQRWAPRLAEACVGDRAASAHGDVMTGHNALYVGDDLAGLIDPAAVVGPAMLELARAVAFELEDGANPDPLLAAYAARAAGVASVDQERLAAMLPAMLAVRLAVVRDFGTGQRAAGRERRLRLLLAR